MYGAWYRERIAKNIEVSVGRMTVILQRPRRLAQIVQYN